MTSIGETLRRERLRQGLDLQQVSQSTKIGTRMLQAMEADDLSKLPGGVFTRSFIKQYAIALGMDASALEPELRALRVEGDEGSRPEARRSGISAGIPTFPSFSDSGSEPNSLLISAIWVVIALLFCGGVYYVMNRDTGTAKAQQTITPRQLEKPVESAPAPQPDDAPAAKTPAVAPPGTGPVQVVLSASEPTWISVAADGKSAYIGVLKPNEKKEISAAEKVKVVAGNAGGLEISLNGKPLDPVGPRGQVRVVELTQAGAQVIPRTPPPNPAPLF